MTEQTSVLPLMSRLLIDTNVLVYSKDISSGFHQASIKLFKGPHHLFTTSKNLAEYYAVVTKGETPVLTATEALKDLTEFVSYCEVLYPTPVSFRKLQELIQLYQPKGLTIHDIEIASIAMVNGVDKVATFNRQDFQRIIGIEVVVPGV